MIPMMPPPAPPAPPAPPPAPPPVTESLGIIFPPADVRGIVDKTAEFVAKNGPEFEQRVLADTSSGQKFSFILPGNPYRAYFDAKVKEFLTGEASESTQKQIPQAILERQKRESDRKQKKDELLALTAYSAEPQTVAAVDEKEQRQILSVEDDRPPEPPPDDQYSVGHPYAAALDIDVIKLTAQYVGRNGQKFLVGLGQRERGNPQFAFLRSTHPLFAYFTALVDAYSRCLIPEKATISRLKGDCGVTGKMSDKPGVISDLKLVDGVPQIPKHRYSALFNILHRVHERQRWEAFEEQQREDKEKRETEERESMQAMDWHEFTVVEVIDFTDEDDHLPLGAPIDISTLTQPKPIAPLASVLGASVAAEIHAAIGAEGMALLKEDVEMSKPKKVEQVTPVESVAPSTAPTAVAETPNAPLVVVKDYVRVGKKRGRADLGMQKCPITGQMVPTDQMTEHLRVVLLDPKWKEQKDAVMEKAKKETALADSSDFGINLAEFVVNRPDLFGTVEDEVESAYVPAPKQRKG